MKFNPTISSDKSPSFDICTFLANFHGMEDLATELAQSFLNNLPMYVADVEAAFDSRSFRLLEIAAHRLKGSISNFHAEAAREKAYRIETLSSDGQLNVAAIHATIVELKAELKRLESDLLAGIETKWAL